MFSFANVKGIIFDLDDTLVKTQLDFAGIKRDINCPPEADILSFIAALTPREMQAQAQAIVLEHEFNDANTSTWMEGAEAFVRSAIAHGLPCAIVTRNCREATLTKIKNNSIPIDLVLTREDAPAKPDPSALHQVNLKWNFNTQEIAYIGDYEYDIEAAHNADMQAWLFRRHCEGRAFIDCLSYIPKQVYSE